MTDSEARVDVLVVGGGPAGIAASTAAATRGARVLLVDEGVSPGGQIWRPSIAGSSPSAAQRWRMRLAASGATVMGSTGVVDVRPCGPAGFVATACSAERTTHIEARQLIIATGARERFLPFPGWTLPGVFGIGGAQALLKSGLSFRGRRVVVAGSGPLLLPVAAALRKAGARLALVAEQAPASVVARFAVSLARRPGLLLQAVRLRSAFPATRYATGTWITGVQGGGTGIQSATLTDDRETREVECDTVCAAFGLVPNLELARLLGCAVERGFVAVDDTQATTVAGIFCAGEPTGIGGVELALVEGTIAGTVAAAGPVATSGGLSARRRALQRHARALDAAFALRREVLTLATADTIVCRCEDVRLGELDRGWTARQAKLYCRIGMGACQGRICGAALESIMGWAPPSVRPPALPARIGAMLDGSHTEY